MNPITRVGDVDIEDFLHGEAVIQPNNLTKIYIEPVILQNYIDYNRKFPNVFPSLEVHMAIIKATYAKLYEYYQRGYNGFKRQLQKIIQGDWLYKWGIHPIQEWVHQHPNQNWEQRQPNPVLVELAKEVIAAYDEQGFVFRYFGFLSKTNPQVQAKMGLLELNKNTFNGGSLLKDKSEIYEDVMELVGNKQRKYNIARTCHRETRYASSYLGWKKSDLVEAIKASGLMDNSSDDLVSEHKIRGRSSRRPQLLLESIGIYRKGTLNGFQNTAYYPSCYYESIYRTINPGKVVRDLMFYIKNNNIEGVQKLLNEGVDPNQPIKNKLPLFEAIGRTTNVNMVRLLLKKGADPNLLNKEGYNPLIFAINVNNIGIIKLLLENGADPNLPKRNALSWALIKNYDSLPEVIRLLIKNKTNPNARDTNNKTALFYAVSSSNVPLVQFLLDNGADINHLDTYGRTVLFYAVDVQDPSIDIVRFLLDNGANPNQNNVLGLSIRKELAIDFVRMLIEKGSDVNYVDNRGKNILFLALEYILPNEIIRLLLDSGAKPDADNMTWVMARNDIEKLRWFLAFGASPFVDEILCPTEECRREISEWQWNEIEENVNRLARQYSRTGDFQLPKEVWQLILLRRRQKSYCSNLNDPKYKNLLAFFAIYLEIPINADTTKSQLCDLISKQLSFGGAYGEKSVKYLETTEGREKIFKTAMMLGIDPNQPFQNIMDQISEKLRI